MSMSPMVAMSVEMTCVAKITTQWRGLVDQHRSLYKFALQNWA